MELIQLIRASMDQLQTDGDFLLNTRFRHLARNTIDYWMLPDSQNLTEQKIIRTISQSPVTEQRTFRLYLHIPFCAQTCSFCAFSGGNSLDFAFGNEYVKLLILQLDRILDITPVYGRKRIRSVHIGGGSPDLLHGNIGRLLNHVRSLKGIDDKTEIAIGNYISERYKISKAIQSGKFKQNNAANDRQEISEYFDEC